jgi:hypothetical protein
VCIGSIDIIIGYFAYSFEEAEACLATLTIWADGDNAVEGTTEQDNRLGSDIITIET